MNVDMSSLSIVASPYMCIETVLTVDNGGKRGIFRNERRKARWARNNGESGIWVYVAYPNGCNLVSRQCNPEWPIWKQFKKMGLSPLDASRILVPGIRGRTINNVHWPYPKTVDVYAIAMAIDRLMSLWPIERPVDWRVREALPDDPNQSPSCWTMHDVEPTFAVAGQTEISPRNHRLR